MDETHTTELGRLPHILLPTFIMGKLPTFFFFWKQRINYQQLTEYWDKTWCLVWRLTDFWAI